MMACRLAVVLVLAVALLGTVAASPVEATGSEGHAVDLRIDGSPFDPNGDGARESVSIVVELADPSTVGISVQDFNGRRVRTLASDERLGAGLHAWTWNGRDGKGKRVPYGPYRVKVIAKSATGVVRKRLAWVTRASRVPYRVDPGAIVVALDPGHGGPAAGAVWRGLKEDQVNLDIGLRLEAMLKGAGIGVVMTRRTDRNVSRVGLDLNGDKRYTRLDELIARNDVANRARADLRIAIHNNASSCRCVRGTTMFTSNKRTWSPEGRLLARRVLDDHIRQLDRLPGYRAKRRGVLYADFKALKPYRRRAMPRPSLQPSILGESLFIDRPAERKILGKRTGRNAIAAAYFDGIARFLAQRRYGMRYEVLDAPRTVAAGGKASVRLRLTNRGRRTSSSWRITVRVVPAVLRYDGRPLRGKIVRRVAIPDGLAPGQSVDVTVPGIPLPSKRRKWLVKFDTALPGGDTMARRGVVGPQLRIRTVAP